MKRLTAIILLICMSALFFNIPISAEGEVYVAAGNTVLPLSNALPIRSSGVWYIDYQCFSKGNLNVNTSYNAAEAMLVLYTWDTTLIFDLNSTIAYTAADKIQYKAVAFVANGTVYVPVQFTAQMLGFDYTYFSDLPMIRIKRSGDIQDNMFMYIAESEIAEMKKATPKPTPSPDIPHLNPSLRNQPSNPRIPHLTKKISDSPSISQTVKTWLKSSTVFHVTVTVPHFLFKEMQYRIAKMKSGVLLFPVTHWESFL